ncbi:uncharacterized protein L969DRAFT_91510 [Mixia osmundae IAM 14324]|uniref:Uncharacterized protein n=1 Tax=Mixia osmundae (strain CBS 9802 / IAM 14324 / JCM 22182 / KY 12970) TaxID=764103 RepID=G7DVC4_MIXOS|nr:uncharacterized protein L969DRAFT_91510 [Mixia osmundae IAM 14324]KEI42045.1 hypothetical protein L969DRAFT_91510 [Mixia osmundae IAM 14324]GAA94534.1 hypothetical protein E5Q_01186 [Mixia osmundae IAM 14324]
MSYSSNAYSHPSASLIENVPLIKNPSLWLPRPIELPQDIHPLPEDVSAYFVYPWTLETHVLSPPEPHPSHAILRSELASTHQKRLRVLQAREDEKVRRRREALQKMAPGYSETAGTGSVLQPKRMSSHSQPPAASITTVETVAAKPDEPVTAADLLANLSFDTPAPAASTASDSTADNRSFTLAESYQYSSPRQELGAAIGQSLAFASIALTGTLAFSPRKEDLGRREAPAGGAGCE